MTSRRLPPPRARREPRLSTPEPARPARTTTVTNEAIIDATRAMLAEVPFRDFSVRELAKALAVVPGTIYARFGTKDELLVQLYIQTLDGVSEMLDGFEVTPAVTVVDAVRAIAPSVGRLQRDFGTYFDAYPPGRESVRDATWARLQTHFQRMSRRLHATISAAAANEGVTLLSGSLAERLLWTLVTSASRQRTAAAYGHRNANYERFVAQ
jgi:AcrR family transcriptional regulator